MNRGVTASSFIALVLLSLSDEVWAKVKPVGPAYKFVINSLWRFNPSSKAVPIDGGSYPPTSLARHQGKGVE
jgi:hypothetical protein